MLRACVARDWPLTYTDPGHPLQRQIARLVTSITAENGDPVGVDGCGVPSFRVTTTGLARAFACLAADPDLAPIAQNMARFAALTSDGDRAEARLARWSHAAVKGGAQGCLGVAWFGGLGIGAKAWSGDLSAAAAATVTVMRRLGILSDHPWEMLDPVARPEVLGGGRPVGNLQVLDGEAA
jgi:L-asparaginase II